MSRLRRHIVAELVLRLFAKKGRTEHKWAWLAIHFLESSHEESNCQDRHLTETDVGICTRLPHGIDRLGIQIPVSLHGQLFYVTAFESCNSSVGHQQNDRAFRTKTYYDCRRVLPWLVHSWF